MIDKDILKNYPRKTTRLSIIWIDYMKAFNMIFLSQILKRLNVVKSVKNMIYQKLYEKLENSFDSRWKGNRTNQHQEGNISELVKHQNPLCVDYVGNIWDTHILISICSKLAPQKSTKMSLKSRSVNSLWVGYEVWSGMF